MDEEATGKFYLEHRLEIPQGIRELQPERMKMERRRDALVADFEDIPFDSVKAVHRNAGDVSRFVVHAQNECTGTGVAERRQFVGQRITSRSGHPIASLNRTDFGTART